MFHIYIKTEEIIYSCFTVTIHLTRPTGNGQRPNVKVELLPYQASHLIVKLE